ncbi:hypothetical protein GIB67_039967, partial [Kingdonia uniflora]
NSLHNFHRLNFRSFGFKIEELNLILIQVQPIKWKEVKHLLKWGSMFSLVRY